METPRTRYTRVDGLSIAYQVFGEGPADLVFVDEWATPLEDRWEVPAIAGRLERLASVARVISFDKRGIGLSDSAPPGDEADPDLWVRDLLGVIDAVGADRPTILGAHEGGPIAMMFAAEHPDRTGSLILVNTGARLAATPDYPEGLRLAPAPPDLTAIEDLWMSDDGGHIHIGATRHDPWWKNWYGRSRRRQASPSSGLALIEMLLDIDVRHIVKKIETPTLIIHRRGDVWWTIDGARWLDRNIDDSRLVELPGEDNYWWSGDADEVVDEVGTFLSGERPSLHNQRELVTLAFTDIVDSTTRASDLGDADWRRVLESHDALVTEIVSRHGGSVVKNLGDGFLLRFAAPASALLASSELHQAVSGLGLELRIAVHTGEVERRGDDLSGVAVHLAARLMGVAEPKETLVTGVIRGLVAGSGFSFDQRESRSFKGIRGYWSVHAYRDAESGDDDYEA